MAKRRYDPQREQFWRDVLARFAASGLSIRAFCRQEQLREPLFYAWRRTIAQRDGISPTMGERPMNRKRSPRRPRKRPAFLPVAVLREALASPGGGISLELRGDRRLRLPESLPVERLAELIHALEAREARP
jgi:transposase-like protein